MSTERHTVEIFQSTRNDNGPRRAEFVYRAHCWTCCFDSAWQEFREDAKAIADRHVEIGGCER